jgi:hypothetical protein
VIGVVVQVVACVWSKASRGAPGSVARAAVPHCLPLEPGFTAFGGGVLWLSAIAREPGFLLRSTSASDLARWIDVAFDDSAGARVEVRFRDRRPCHRPSDPVVCGVSVGAAWRVLWNQRVSLEDGWRYEQYVVNIAGVQPGPVDANLFETADTVTVRDLRVALR